MHPRKITCGSKYNMLTVIDAYCGKRNNVHLHKCICDCGGSRVVSSGCLTRGDVKDCGCMKGSHIKTHGMSSSQEYKVWASIIQRCTNKRSKAYKDYGGRGVLICNEWLNSFDAFYADMGGRPSRAYTIERVNNDLSYSKDNCIWADRFAQAENKRVRRDNKTGFKAVYERSPGRFTATPQRNNKRHYLGEFASAEAANIAIIEFLSKEGM